MDRQSRTPATRQAKRMLLAVLIETYRELLMFETQLARIDATLVGTIAQLDRTVGCPQNGIHSVLRALLALLIRIDS